MKMTKRLRITPSLVDDMKQYSINQNKNKRYPKPKKITVQKQKVALCAAFPEGKCSISLKKKLVWSGIICPSPLSKEYVTVLTWVSGYSPRVWVIGDNLEKLDDPDFPHVYQIDLEHNMVRICLYRHQEFNQYTFIADKIIPWIVEWLYYYELWLATGEWHGGGEHPSGGDQEDDYEGLIKQPPVNVRDESESKLLVRCYQAIMKSNS